jgi:hypothetical protein
MMEKRVIELMNKEIDGTNTPEESRALRACLESSEEARRHYEELRGVAGLFAAAGNVAPPAELHGTIIRSIAEREELLSARAERGWTLRGFFSPRRKIAYSFAAGLALGLVALVLVLGSLSRQSRLDHGDLYGSLGRGRSGTDIASTRVPVAAGGISGFVEIRYKERSFDVALELDSRGEIETVLFPAGSCPVARVEAPSCSAYEIRTAGSSATVKTSGRCGLVVTFRDDAGIHPAVGVSMKAEGRQIFEQMISRDLSGGNSR